MLGVAGWGLSSAYAYQGDPNVQGLNYTSERHEAMVEAFANKDFEAWKEVRADMRNGHMTEIINDEEKFAKFAQTREMRLAGDTEGVNAMRAELGLGHGMKGQGGDYRGMKDGSHRGQNYGGKFVDADGDGQCDHLN